MEPLQKVSHAHTHARMHAAGCRWSVEKNLLCGDKERAKPWGELIQSCQGKETSGPLLSPWNPCLEGWSPSRPRGSSSFLYRAVTFICEVRCARMNALWGRVLLGQVSAEQRLTQTGVRPCPGRHHVCQCMSRCFRCVGGGAVRGDRTESS